MTETLTCGRSECIFKSIEKMIEKMKEEIVSRQNIQYPEQVVVAGIYGLTASTLSEACRRGFKVRLENCIESEKHKEGKITLDTFILLRQLKEDGLVTAEYENVLFNSMLEMEPGIKDQVEKDRELGIL